MHTINIARDFSPSPAGRFPEDGDFNGEVFRDKFLAPAFEKYEKVNVILDGVSGFGSSFLEEAFGGLIRKHILEPESYQDRLMLQYNPKNPDLAFYADLIKEFMKEAREK